VARAYLSVTPDVLPCLPAVLPSGVSIFGTQEGGGSVNLILEGEHLPDGAQLQMIVYNGPLKRTFELKVSDA
jgi:hypothetical protein